MTQDTRPLDSTEAPKGYYAVLKAAAAPKDGSNICRACDWRAECQKPGTDFTARGHRCMSFPIVTATGETIRRNDGQSVLFKLNQ